MRKSYLFAAKGIIASGFLIALITWVSLNVGWSSLLSAWSQLSLGEICLAVCLIFLSHGLRILRVFSAYKRTQPHILLTDVAAVSLLHNTISFMLPMRLGEAALPLLSKRQLNIHLRYSTSTLLLLRLFDAHCLLVLLAFFAAESYLGGKTAGLLWLIIASVPCAIIAVRRLIMKHPRFESIQTLVKSVGFLLSCYGLTALIWGVKLASLAYLAATLGQMPVDHAWIATIIADASALSPITGFANAGTFEAAFIFPLIPLGYDGQTLMKIALNLHLIVLLTNIAAGVTGAIIMFSKKPSKRVQ